jgi:hypothetical protein
MGEASFSAPPKLLGISKVIMLLIDVLKRLCHNLFKPPSDRKLHAQALLALLVTTSSSNFAKTAPSIYSGSFLLL